MNESKPVEMVCSACGKDTLLVRKPKYEGFTRVGDELTCSSCGHEYADEASVPFKGRERVQVFTDGDRSPQVKVFREGEAARLCRYCISYVVNPFMQWCSTHKKEVQATDTCKQFKRKPEPKPDSTPPPEAPKKPVL
ncbi:MAG: hypothetical protein BWY59_00741 [Verrucomicrobia bacterium ADurb.Bin345]|nr:MAG: hypothetical protein BWY59_00741 [Verrucomicrobia bacterium ADurb.Bin345]